VVSQKVTIDVHEVLDQHGDTVVSVWPTTVAFRQDRPARGIVMTNYLSVCDGKIVSLIIMFS